MFLLKIFLNGCPGVKDSFTIRKNFFPTLVATFLLKGGLYHVIFRRLVLSSLRVVSSVFDIVNFYPSISHKLLNDALSFAAPYTDISEEDRKIIFHTKLLPPRNFAVFERQFLPQYYTQRAKNFRCIKFY